MGVRTQSGLQSVFGYRVILAGKLVQKSFLMGSCMGFSLLNVDFGWRLRVHRLSYTALGSVRMYIYLLVSNKA